MDNRPFTPNWGTTYLAETIGPASTLVYDAATQKNAERVAGTVEEEDKMINAGIICAVLIVLSTGTHYEILSLLKAILGRITFIPRRAKILVAILGAMFSHLLQITLFAAAFYLLRDRFGLGVFGGAFKDHFSSFLYFSSETYTSLGFGDIYPMGALRMLTGIEALTGLVMIGWTASFTYLEMAQYWTDPVRSSKR